MQNIRALAAVIEKHRDDPDLEMLAHAAIRSYAIDLLMNLSQAIQPLSQDEIAVVAWLKQEVIKIAAQIPEAKGTKQ